MESWKETIVASLTYRTPVFIFIDDVRLGLLYYGFILLIFVVIVINDILYCNGYMQTEVPAGSVRTTFRLPSEECSTLDNECRLRLGTTANLSYCLNTNETDDKDAATRLPCVFLDPMDAIEDYGSRVLLGTYIETIHQEGVCGLDSLDPDTGAQAAASRHPLSCKRVWNTITGPQDLHPHVGSAMPPPYERPSQVFVADVGRYTMKLDHTITAPGLGISSDNREHRGYLKSNNEVQCRSNPRASVSRAQTEEDFIRATAAPCWIGGIGNFQKKFDVFEVDDLLQAAGVNLDAPTSVSGEKGHSNRREGTFLVVNIVYSNMLPFHLGATDIFYHFEVYNIPGTPTVERSFYSRFPDIRVVEHIHGLKLFINQTGELGLPSFMRLMMTLAAGTTMLAVSTFVVDMIGMYLLPEKATFSSLKYPRTKITQDQLDPKNEEGSSESETLSNSSCA